MVPNLLLRLINLSKRLLLHFRYLFLNRQGTESCGRWQLASASFDISPTRLQTLAAFPVANCRCWKLCVCKRQGCRDFETLLCFWLLL